MRRSLLSFLAICLWSNVAAAQQDEPAIPSALAPWVGWVLSEAPEYRCTWVAGERTCDWPGVLTLRADKQGASFTQSLEVDRKLRVRLPGNDEHWPEDVRANGKGIAIENQEGVPMVTLPRGSHTLSGRFVWPALPDGLQVPNDVARIDLWVDGERLRFARRADDGKLWLAANSDVLAGSSQDGVELEVYRKLQDGIPPTLETVIQVRASGKARELNLGNVLPKNAAPMSVTAGLPVQIDPKNGDLRVQLRAGQHRVQIDARMKGNVTEYSPISAGAPWPAYEIWSWESADALRQVEIPDVPGIDPTRTNMPSAWKSLPAYSLNPTHKLGLKVLRRGQPGQPPNQLRLTRQMWLDLSGDALTVRDRISGTMKQDWRLDLNVAPLGHVALSGEDQLITRSTDSESAATGVEVRDGNLNMQAEWRLQRSGTLPAVGWSQDVQHLQTTLNLPPGWSLLAATGVDQVPDTWVAKWNVYGFFFVLLIAFGIGKVVGWKWFPVALVAFVLGYHEADIPLAVWPVLLVLTFVLRHLPHGVWRTLTEATWACAALTLIFMLAPFLVTQVRESMYPQIEQRYVDYGNFGFGGMASESAATPKTVAPVPGGIEMDARDEAVAAEAELAEEIQEQRPQAPMKELTKSGGSLKRKRNFSRLDGMIGGNSVSEPDGYRAQQRSLLSQDPNAVISTGPGVYNWQWNKANLSWSGPVAKDHQIQLWLVSPNMGRALTVLRVLGLLALGILLLLLHPWRKQATPTPRETTPKAPTPRGGVAAAATLMLLFLGASHAHAQQAFPSSNLLEELSDRVTRDPDCGDDCIELGTAILRVDKETAMLELQVHAVTDTALSLPGPVKSWVPEEIRLNGRSVAALRLDEGTGFLQLKIPSGTHTLQLGGPVPPQDVITLEFVEQPHRFEIQAPEWEVIGLREDGRIDGSLQLQRSMEQNEESTRASVSRLPPWFSLTRRIEIGLRWSLSSTLTRKTPVGSPEVVRIPLLPGESVTESDLEIENGELVVSLGRDERERTWSSSLNPVEQDNPVKSLKLTAAKDRPWTEVWRLTCGPIWRCTADNGVPPISHLSGSQWSPVYRPWPGETLNLSFTQPAGVEGARSTIDNATLQLSPGNRRLSATLQATIRTSQGGTHRWTIPKGAAVQSLSLNDGDTPIEVREGKLETTLKPGSNTVEIQWQQNVGMETKFLAPAVALGGQAVNLRTEVTLPRDRWLIWASGPSWGPAILFWSHLFLILLLGLLASRIPKSPLRLHEWFLLGLGLTQVPTWVTLLLAGWFFALAYRRDKPFASAGAFDITQLALVFYTLIALGCFYWAVHTGLLVDPDWQVEGQGSHNGQLNWYLDRSSGAMPEISIISLPLGVWRGVMLVWALWLAWKTLGWLRWAWDSFSAGGRWKTLRRPPRTPTPPRGGPGQTAAPAKSTETTSPAATPPVPAGVNNDAPAPRTRRHTPRASLPPEGLGFSPPEEDGSLYDGEPEKAD